MRYLVECFMKRRRKEEKVGITECRVDFLLRKRTVWISFSFYPSRLSCSFPKYAKLTKLASRS